jgi:hypothetical protein
LKNGVLQVFGLHVASGAAGGEPVVVPGLVRGKVVLLSAELMEASTCKFLQFHEVVWFKFKRQVVLLWGGIRGVLVGCTVLKDLGFCDRKVGEEVAFRVVVEEEGF